MRELRTTDGFMLMLLSIGSLFVQHSTLQMKQCAEHLEQLLLAPRRLGVRVELQQCAQVLQRVLLQGQVRALARLQVDMDGMFHNSLSSDARAARMLQMHAYQHSTQSVQICWKSPRQFVALLRY
jgi:hypothetical protein